MNARARLVATSVMLTLAGLASEAWADPVFISAADALGPAGAPGTGACAVTRQAPDGIYLGTLGNAVALLDGPISGAAGEKRYLFATPDYTNGTLISGGDFDVDQPFPFSALGDPIGDGERFATRVSGQLRIETAGTVTFAVRADDGFRLQIGGHVVLDHPAVQTSKVASRVVTFESSGRYELLLEHFENRFDSVLEWSQSAGVHAEVFEAQSLPDASFTLLTTDMLVAPNGSPDCALPGDGGGGSGGGGGSASGGGGGSASGGGGGGAGGSATGGSGGGADGGGGSGGLGAGGGGGQAAGGGAPAPDGEPSLWGTAICATRPVHAPDAGLASLVLAALVGVATRRRR